VHSAPLKISKFLFRSQKYGTASIWAKGVKVASASELIDGEASGIKAEQQNIGRSHCLFAI